MAGTPSQMFFQAILVVIPALFFGGVLSGAIPKPDRTEKPRAFYALGLLTLIVFLPVMIEAQALRGALGRDPGTVWVYVSVIYVLGATAAIGVALVRPWLPIVSSSTGWKSATVVVIAVIPVLVGSIYMPDTIRALDLRVKATQDGGVLDEDALDRYHQIGQGFMRTQISIARNLYHQGRISRGKFLEREEKSLTEIQAIYVLRISNNNQRAFSSEP